MPTLENRVQRAKWRVFVAALIAPLAVVPIVLAFTLLPGAFSAGRLDSFDWDLALLIVWIVFGVTLVGSLIIGIPVFLTLARKNVYSPLMHGAVGGLIGMFAGLLLGTANLVHLAMAMVCGAAVGLVFRIVAGKHTQLDNR